MANSWALLEGLLFGNLHEHALTCGGHAAATPFDVTGI